MVVRSPFPYSPTESECEKAAYSYMIGLFAVVVALPLPIINLLTACFFYLANRRATYFVRFHSLQNVVAQLPLFVANSVGFWWTVRVLLGWWEPASDLYFGYMLTIILANVIEIIGTIYSSIQVRKGQHVEWWVFGGLTHFFCKP